MKAIHELTRTLGEKVQALSGDESGASAVEYGLLASLIAAAIIVTLRAMGSRLTTVFQNVTNGMQ